MRLGSGAGSVVRVVMKPNGAVWIFIALATLLLVLPALLGVLFAIATGAVGTLVGALSPVVISIVGGWMVWRGFWVEVERGKALLIEVLRGQDANGH